MRSRSVNLGNRLASVALRYRNPYVEGVSRGSIFGSRQPVPRPKEVGICLLKRGVDVPDNRASRLEALLFLSRHPQTSRKLAELAGLADGTKARTLVRTLNRRYDATGSAFRIEEVAGGFQLMTRPKFAPWLRRLYPATSEVRLSPPAMETLAVVAYRQPVLRAEIEAIRGVQSGEVLRQLIERDLVRIAGRSEELGRPFLYGTTKQFLQIFGLRHLDELPRADVLRPHGPTPTSDDIQNRSDTNIPKQTNQSQAAAEEENVRTLSTTMTRPITARKSSTPSTASRRKARPGDRAAVAQREEEEVDDEEIEDEDEDEEEFEEEQDFEEEDDDAEDEEEDDDDDLDDEPWEEVEDDDDDLDEDEDEDWDEDEEWEDEDWDEDEDEDEDWDEDEEEEEEDEE
jgi:segregation and condensation protein B